MIHSMTGFGRASGPVLGREVSIEIRTVNSRFREVVVRQPKAYSAIEDGLKKIIQSRLVRGRVEVSVQVNESSNNVKRLKVDMDLAKAYHEQLGILKDELGLTGEVALPDLIQFRDIFAYQDEELDMEAFLEGAGVILNASLDKLIEMRQTEGVAIAKDLNQRLAAIADMNDRIESKRDVVLTETREKLKNRLAALTENMELDEGRLLQEIAYLADRSDITEEIVRLRSHVSQFSEVIQTGGVSGRRLDFLLQEMNREANTIGSKSTDVDITNWVVGIKTELEKLREQVQNVE